MSHQLIKPPAVALEVLTMLGIDSIHLTTHPTLREDRGYEELGKTIQSLFQIIGPDSEKVVGVLDVRVRIVIATVVSEVVRIGSFLGVLLATVKQHVLTKVCQALVGRWVTEATHGNVHCCGAQLSLVVRYEEYPQAITELIVAVLASVMWRLCNWSERW